jgi:hypothetical protein
VTLSGDRLAVVIAPAARGAAVPTADTIARAVLHQASRVS